MGELRNALARALIADVARQTNGDWPVNTRGDASDVFLVDAEIDFGELADCILGILREPTPEMIQAGDDAMDSDCHFECGGERAWRAMIDAAVDR